MRISTWRGLARDRLDAGQTAPVPSGLRRLGVGMSITGGVLMKSTTLLAWLLVAPDGAAGRGRFVPTSR